MTDSRCYSFAANGGADSVTICASVGGGTTDSPAAIGSTAASGLTTPSPGGDTGVPGGSPTTDATATTPGGSTATDATLPASGSNTDATVIPEEPGAPQGPTGTSTTYATAPGDSTSTTSSSGGDRVEVMCPAFEKASEPPTCVECLEAGCGWTEDDGDCLESCDTVNDGAECIEKDLMTPTEICNGGSSGVGTSSDVNSAAEGAIPLANYFLLAIAPGLLMI